MSGVNVSSGLPSGPLPGINTPILNPNNRPQFGGGIKGRMPAMTKDKDSSDLEYAQSRFSLREAWNNHYQTQLNDNGRSRIITPFRAVNNAGDLLSRQNYSCGGSSQTSQSRPGVSGLKGRFGSILSKCDGSNIPPATCNTKYVYDGSDYTRFLKQRSINQNYNDLSSGGNENNASQSFIRRVRRF